MESVSEREREMREREERRRVRRECGESRCEIKRQNPK